MTAGCTDNHVDVKSLILKATRLNNELREAMG